MIRNQTISMGKAEPLARLERQILQSYAHNSQLYAALEQSASLEVITHFLRWDAAQPPFFHYLRQWVDKVPPHIRGKLEGHIAVEESERHSALFKEMMAYLDTQITSSTVLDEARLERLNYTFSPQCAAEQDAGFFLGGFWATELMSAKRCLQIHRGLKRNGVPDSALTYLRIHFEADSGHGTEVKEMLIEPSLERSPELLGSIGRGVHDRLQRSGEYLMWYELNALPDLEQPAA